VLFRSSGETSVTARGVCWNTTGSPTIADSKTVDGSGTGSFTSSLTGLTQNTTYYVRAYATNSGGTAYGVEVNFKTLPPPQAPSGLTVSEACNYVEVYWVNNNTTGVKENIVEQWDGTDWILKSTEASGNTESLIGAAPNTQVVLRVCAVDNDDDKYCSAAITGNTSYIAAPTGVTAVIENTKDVRINWTNLEENGSAKFVYRTQGGVGDLSATLNVTATTYLDTTTQQGVTYCYQAGSNCSVYNFLSTPAVCITIPITFLPPFCDGDNYTVSATTCGNADGSVNITNVDYHLFYDFVLTDVQGNVQALTGLTSGYYFLTATVKPEYWYYYGRETCTFEWLKVEDTDTTMSNTGASIRNIICGGFGKSQGRIAYLCEDSGLNAPYTAKLYNKETLELVMTVTGDTIERIIFVPLNAGNYYTHITNDAGCSLLLGSTQVSGESLRSVAGIRTLWLTKWVNTIEYDYWKQSDEDYYLSGLDANFFNSIKIKRFIDETLPDIWYSVNVLTKGITFNQSLEKSKQGFVFNDKLTLTIPQADNAKWKELVDILQDRYILVFQDNNGDYWCTGYKYGAKINAYRLENNEYVLEFQAISDNKLLTSLDSAYVVSSIL
jgi:hypothetical protein